MLRANEKLLTHSNQTKKLEFVPVSLNMSKNIHYRDGTALFVRSSAPPHADRSLRCKTRLEATS